MLIYITRHGETVANLEGLLPTPGVELTERGRAQSALVAAYFQGKPIDAIYCSNQKRCVVSSGPISHVTGAPLIVYPSLRDMDYGAFGGKSFSEREVDDAIDRINAREPGYRFPGGGNFFDLEKRVASGLGRILHSGKDGVVIVSHRDTNKVIIRKLLAPYKREARGLDFGHTDIYQFDTQSGLLFESNPVRLRDI